MRPPIMENHDHTEVSYKQILKLAWPASIAASITPLLGAIDVWALGQSSTPLAIAAVGLAATIFSLAYWTFGFIRMSVAGLTAQACGANDIAEERLSFLRGFILAISIGTGLLIFQKPLGGLAFDALEIGSQASLETFKDARTYFYIRIWGAPFALATYACLGWLTAKGRTDLLMLTGIVMTVINVILDILFVLKFEMGARGIAIGTLVAEIAGLLIASAFVFRVYLKNGVGNKKIDFAALFEKNKVLLTLSINRDIFIRTLLLAFSFSWFIQRGSAYGDVTLAANQILLQLFLFTGLALDGTAIAAETLVGRSLGSRLEYKADGQRSFSAVKYYDSIVRKAFTVSTIFAVFFTLTYIMFGQAIISLLTDAPAINQTANNFLIWIVLSPVIVMVCFQLDGIFIGATRSTEMRNSMIMSVLVFLPLSLWSGREFGNHGLWFSFSVFFLMRAITLFYYLPRIRKTILL